jgi:hypothetical protein
MRYVLHIGMHKTGTTTIQGHLQANWQGYARQGVEVPGFDGKRSPKSHEVFFEHFDGHPSETVADWLGRRPDPAPQVRVISFERFWEASEDCIHRVSQAVGERTSVIVFIRDPVEHAISHCAQLIKKKFKVVSLAQYLAPRLPARGVASYYNYDEALRRWGEGFADLRTLVYTGDDSVAAFIEAARLPPVDPAREQPAQNVTLPPVGTAALLRINRMAVAGTLSRRDAMQAKAAVRGNPGGCTDLFRPHAVSVSVDTSEFAEAFIEANPIASTRFAIRGGPVAWVSDIDLSDAEFIKALRQLPLPP